MSKARRFNEREGNKHVVGEQTAEALRLAYRALTLTEANSVLEQLRCPVCFMGNAADRYTAHADDCELAVAKAAIRALLPDVTAGIQSRR